MEAEDFLGGVRSAAAVGFTVEVDSAAEAHSGAEVSEEDHSVAAAGFAGELAFAEEPFGAASDEAFVAIASAAVSGSVDAALDGEAGDGVGA